MLAKASATWLSLETSQIIAWVSGSSCSSARIRSGERAKAITRTPPPAKRRTIADPVPGPTPVTTAIGLSVTEVPRHGLRLLLHNLYGIWTAKAANTRVLILEILDDNRH